LLVSMELPECDPCGQGEGRSLTISAKRCKPFGSRYQWPT
jgi:hypothetical protein